MSYLISVDETYAAGLGRAVYVFSYLEWGVSWVGEALAPGFLDQAVKLTAGQMAREFEKVVDGCGRDPELMAALKAISGEFIALVDRRNDLIHSTPHTAADGEQRLLRQKKQLDWTTDEIDAAIHAFEKLAIEVNDLFYSKLKVTVQG